MMYGIAISLFNTTRWIMTASVGTFTRLITESGQYRITEDNQSLIIE